MKPGGILFPQVLWNLEEFYFFHADPISLRFQPGYFCPPEIKVSASMYYILKTISSPGKESLFRPWGGITFPSLGWKQYQSDSFPGVEKLFLFWILSPQISILPWLGLHKAWNLQMNLGVTLKKNIPQLKSKLCQSGRAGIRTGDLLCHNRRLSRLSYFETWLKTDGKSTYLCWLG